MLCLALPNISDSGFRIKARKLIAHTLRDLNPQLSFWCLFHDLAFDTYYGLLQSSFSSTVL
jgi:hypothetical protein